MQEICTSGSVGGRLALVASRSTRPAERAILARSSSENPVRAVSRSPRTSVTAAARCPRRWLTRERGSRRTRVVVERGRGAPPRPVAG
jgi:hypothetical protein